MDIKELRRQYDSKKEVYRQLEGEAKYILEDALAEKDLKYDRVESRIKKFDSFEKKVERKEISDLGNIDSITDFLGLRVICLFLSDLDKVKKVILEEFEVVSEDDKVASESVDQFGYRSIHYIVKLKEECAGRRYSKIKNYEFEIQVRTLAMHSWANISHHLSYKNEESTPAELQKDFHALSALFYLADDKFESIYKKSIENRKRISSVIGKQKLLELPIDLDTMKSYLKSNMKSRVFSDRDDKDVSKLISEIKKFGISTLNQLDSILNIVEKYYEEYEKETFRMINAAKADKFKNRFGAIGAVRLSLCILSERYSAEVKGGKEREKSFSKHREKIPEKELEKIKNILS